MRPHVQHEFWSAYIGLSIEIFRWLLVSYHLIRFMIYGPSTTGQNSFRHACERPIRPYPPADILQPYVNEGSCPALWASVLERNTHIHFPWFKPAVYNQRPEACFAFTSDLFGNTFWRTIYSLETFWGEGTFNDKTGYRFGAGQGLVLEQTRCISGPAYTLYIKALLDSVGNSILLTSDGWDSHFWLLERDGHWWVLFFAGGVTVDCMSKPSSRPCR